MAESAAETQFSDAKNGGFSSAYEWFDLLSKHRSGCSEVWLQTFRGRGGFVTFKELRCKDAAGKVVGPKVDAGYDADKLSREAHDLCTKHQKKNLSDTRYRMQLMVRRKAGGELHQGEYVTLYIGADGYTERDDFGRGTESAVVKILADHNKDLRQFFREIVGSQVQMVQGVSGSIMMVHEFGDSMMRREMERSRATASSVVPRVPATAEQINQRVAHVASAVAEPLRLFAHAAAGSNARSAEALQLDLQALWAELTGEQKDEIKKLVGQAMWDTLNEIIAGPVDQFARERRWFRPSLMEHMEGIKKILTAEQWRRLLDLI